MLITMNGSLDQVLETFLYADYNEWFIRSSFRNIPICWLQWMFR